MTLDRTRPLTYEMAMIPEKIGTHKSFNSFNTGQLEGMLGWKKSLERGGTLLSYKLFIEDLFIRKFMKGTWSELFVSEIIVKRQYNTIRISGMGSIISILSYYYFNVYLYALFCRLLVLILKSLIICWILVQDSFSFFLNKIFVAAT